MKERIEALRGKVEEFKGENLEAIENFRISILGRKGELKALYEEFKSVPNELKREVGQQLNILNKSVTEKIERLKSDMKVTEGVDPSFDKTRPGGILELGSRHPISLVRNEIVDIFRRIGFSVSEGPEVEDDWHNFSALNFPPEHPARDMQDTFFIEDDISLRTHTSSVQVRVMESSEPPIRTISPGRVFRNEAISARSHCIFHQIEGLYIDKKVSFADLKQTLLYFAKEFFGDETKIRLRPSYFPFTEPSAEMDVYWGLKTETDHKITKGTGWLEILGCGMVDPNVLKNNNIDPDEYSGFAFGMGIERIAMLKYQIGDIRMLFENDIEFLKQFKSGF
ncbi:MAG: phenylalanyl-tRNA synthetase alpha chain [Patiriisocius sp.]|jgi:phenylalanyl-tRNA synthetase alpha chain